MSNVSHQHRLQCRQSLKGVQAKCEWGLTPSQESLITSVVFVGTMSGAYAWGSLGDAKGRKLGFFATALFTFTFGVLSAVAPSYGVYVCCECTTHVKNAIKQHACSIVDSLAGKLQL